MRRLLVLVVGWFTVLSGVACGPDSPRAPEPVDAGPVDDEKDAAPACRAGAEACNGQDDDCDGVIDDVGPEACGAGRGCVAGQCACLLGQSDCAGACVDVLHDPAHCGACGQGCGDAEACVDGACVERDACAAENGGCDPLTVCTQVAGGRTCSACPAGYAGTGEAGCNDVDECASSSAGCDPRRACINTLGGHECGTCAAGYEPVGDTGCRNVNECLVDNGGCDPRRACIDLDGSVTCGACPAGYRLSEGACLDVDECAIDHGGCDPQRACVNEEGSSRCGACPAGFVADGSRACRDADECATDRGGCHPLRSCENTPGSRVCGPCSAGYVAVGETDCADVDECATDHGGCDPRTTCTNLVGSVACGACPAGHSGDGTTGCADIDECTSVADACDPLTGCTNLEGSYTCSACPAGYRGDGIGGCAPVLLDVQVSRRARFAPDLSPAQLSYDLEFDVDADVQPRVGLVVADGVQVRAENVLRTSGELFAIQADLEPRSLAVTLTGRNGRTAQYELRVRTGCAVVERTHFKPPDVYSAAQYGAPIMLDDADLYISAYWDRTDPDHVGAIYHYSGGRSNWQLGSIMRVPDASEFSNFGVAMVHDDEWMMVGASFLDYQDSTTSAPYAGGVYVFHREAAGWEHTQTLRASLPLESAWLGEALALSGDWLAVSATGANGMSGAVYVFERDGDTWLEHSVIEPPAGVTGARFGWPLVFAQERLLVGVPNEWVGAQQTGAVHAYQRDANGFHHAFDYLPPLSARNWGGSLTVSADGQRLFIGESEYTDGPGELFMYRWLGTHYDFVTRFYPEPTPDRERYGVAVATGSDWLAVGAPYGSTGDRTGGYVDMFRDHAGTFTPCGRVRSSYARAGHSFGAALESRGDALFVSSPGEHSNATGINGIPTVFVGAEAGAAFEFEVGAYNLVPE